jgi:hypothetical protein
MEGIDLVNYLGQFRIGLNKELVEVSSTVLLL